MFKQSLLLILALVAITAIISFSGNLMALKALPSSYDAGLTLDVAFKDKTTPVLVEFYTDSCRSCQILTPMLHGVMQNDGFKKHLRWVMVNAEDANNAPFVNLFGVDSVPTVVVFDFSRMKKHPIPLEELESPQEIQTSLSRFIRNRDA
jgi:thioredoxin-like negative regulator of GroEL